MNIVEIKTLIDITSTGVGRPNQGTQIELNQQRNWVTLSQCIGIRSLIEYYNTPTVETVDIKGLGFGKKFQGKHQVWTFRFETDQPLVYGVDCELLIADLDQVPVIKKLTETINIDMAVFDTSSTDFKNTIIRHPQAL
jgi:hypothetical protein